MMKRKTLATLTAVLMAILFSVNMARASVLADEDTDTRFVGAKVVEVNERHISIIARSGVEHVIAVDRTGTKVSRSGNEVKPEALRVGDVVTVELDAESPLKLARHISVGAPARGDVAGLGN
jgi:hypothetical protein